MVVRLVLWNLADTTTSLVELRRQRIGATPGAMSETWISDEATARFGAFAVFADADAAAAPVDERVLELIGKPPDVFELFDLEEVDDRAARRT